MIVKVERQNRRFQITNYYAFQSLLCFLLSSLSSTVIFAIEPIEADSNAIVGGIDTVFDGGSILLDLKINNVQHYILIVSPESPIAEKFTPSDLNILLSTGTRFSESSIKILSEKDLTQLVLALGRSEFRKLNQDVASLLLGMKAGLKFKVWGETAVEMLENGKWLSIFTTEVPRAEIHLDPFK